ncbi:MAG TPA: hypothetical protein VF488_02530 [Gemmatimonadaceae bacterium]
MSPNTTRSVGQRRTARSPPEVQIADLQDQLRTIAVDLESATGKRRGREQCVGGDRRAMLDGARG